MLSYVDDNRQQRRGCLSRRRGLPLGISQRGLSDVVAFNLRGTLLVVDTLYVRGVKRPFFHCTHTRSHGGFTVYLGNFVAFRNDVVFGVP